MNRQLYTVALTDLGSYEVTVAADTVAEAEFIAKDVLYEEAAKPTPGLKILKREVDAHAEPAAEQPLRSYRVRATYSLEFTIDVPAGNTEDALRHAQRMYGAMPFPWEYDHCEQEVNWYGAQEVVR